MSPPPLAPVGRLATTPATGTVADERAADLLSATTRQPAPLTEHGKPGSNGIASAPPVPVARLAPADSWAAQVLLEVVADKTGYPVDMLELDMQLDADLGIDSIKRVEILSAIQDRMPEAPAVKPEHLGSLRTLRQIAEFLGAADEAVPVLPRARP